MGVIHGLPSDVEETLIDIAAREGSSDYVGVLQRAVAELRKRLFDPAKPVTITIEVGAEFEALACTTRGKRHGCGSPTRGYTSTSCAPGTNRQPTR